MINDTDIDIDMADRDKLLSIVNHVDASMIGNGVIKKHNVGVYFQDAPRFMNTNMCSIDYKETGKYGFFKIDVLNNSVYEDIENEEQLDYLMNLKVDWNLLKEEEVVNDLPHLSNHYHLVNQVRPKSVKELADVLALMRPAKKGLLDLYLSDKEEARKALYTKPTNGEFYFKYSHAIAYAVSITIRMNYIKYVLRA